MPLYEYDCPEHGTFEARRPMAEFDAQGTCPACQCSSPRVLSVPRLRTVDPSQRAARDRNERSQHEPKLVTREPRAPTEAGRPTFHSSGSLPWAVTH
jgi:putative FmdB family regulatory protein